MATAITRPEQIERTVFKSKEVAPEMDSFAEEVARVLGYSRLKKNLKANALRNALVSLEMETLDTREVDKYKSYVLHKAQEDQAESEGEEDDEFLEWDEVELSDYNEPVPEFVLAKALELKKKVPEVVLYVEYLGVRYDPFLIAEMGDERYYIEVWDEPKFEGRLTKEPVKEKKAKA